MGGAPKAALPYTFAACCAMTSGLVHRSHCPLTGKPPYPLASGIPDRSSSETWGDTGQDSQRLRQEPMGHTASPPNSDSVGAGRGRYGEVPSSSGASQEDSQERQRVWDAARHGSPVDWGKWEPAVRRWEAIRQVEAPPPVIDGKLNHWAVEWMMGLPTGWVCDVIEHRTTALKMLGNGVVPQQAALAYRLLL